MSSPIFTELFRRRDISCNLPSNSIFPVPNVKSTFHGSKSISYLGPKTCGILTLEQKECLQKNIKKWQRKNCFCRVHLKYFRKVFLKKILPKIVFDFYVIFNAFQTTTNFLYSMKTSKASSFEAFSGDGARSFRLK